MYFSLMIKTNIILKSLLQLGEWMEVEHSDHDTQLLSPMHKEFPNHEKYRLQVYTLTLFGLQVQVHDEYILNSLLFL